MAYLGNQPVVGDSANTFQLLDDIASFTLTFDATDTGIVSISGDTLTFNNHRFVNLQRVTYADGGGTAIGGLTDGTAYFIIKVDQNTIKLATSSANAAAGTAINLTSGAAGGSHTLTIAFDGINTKFKATHSNGTKSNVNRAAQISLSINGVIQQPSEGSSPTVGYSVEPDSTIVFSSAPQAGDNVFGSFIGEVAASFDIADNTVDEFTANGSTTTFTLSKTVPSSEDVLVTLDGVTQYPSTQSNTRAYTVADNSLIFTSAPANGVLIQARHIGFAGAATPPGVTAFYGRGGNVVLKSTDDVAIQNVSAGIGTFTGSITVGGDLNVSGDLTYDETVARNLNITGIATVASGIVSTGDFKIGTATTLSQDNIFTTGIVTAQSGFNVGIMSAGVTQTTGVITAINFVGTGNTVKYNASSATIDVAISGGGAVGTGTDQIFYESDQTVTQSYTISAGKNAMVAGPLAVASGQTITIPSGSELTIV